uniref:Uncharacterized protein n=1 Tax=Arundo donax TaxID=35708 RepID=A0A0A9H280_ARUDO
MVIDLGTLEMEAYINLLQLS